MAMKMHIGFLLACALFAAAPACAAGASYGPELEGFSYPYPQQHFAFTSQGQHVQMGYMDVPPADGHGNGRTAVLLHGKNFCGATWETTIRALTQAGFRVVAPDQIGFCSSSKPGYYQYTFQQLAENTRALLQSLKVARVVVVAHSTGGMLGARFALMYPDMVERLVMVNPIGLEDWKAKGVPYRTVDQWYARELKLSAASVHQYEQSVYYVGRWKPEFDKWVDMLAGLNQGPGHARVAWNSALIYDMIFTQPVIYELPYLKVPTTLMIGDADTTAIGSDIASPEVRKTLGHYDKLGPEVIRSIPNGHLIVFHGYGHAPQIEAPDMFHKALLAEIGH
ncbi:MAG: alpha/beta hydrolase [Rhizomicrobium sp.]